MLRLNSSQFWTLTPASPSSPRYLPLVQAWEFGYAFAFWSKSNLPMKISGVLGLGGGSSCLSDMQEK